MLVSAATVGFSRPVDPDSPPLGGVRYDPATHVAVGSAGCGKSSPYTAGKTTTATGKYAGVTWTYRIHVPKSYNKNTPMPLILQHPGWGMSASSEDAGAGISKYADAKGFISVTPQGMNDNTHNGGPWYSWNAVGTTQSPGPGGATCTQKASAASYCYTSCGSCSDSPQCWWTTCDETVTPTGTGTKDVGGFIPGLYDTLESQLCIDTTREYASGESNGGMQTYQLGVDLASRLAAITPEFGSFHYGFNLAPDQGVPVMDLHGSEDGTVPANVSLSDDGYYYTPVTQIFRGNSFSSGWMASNGCSGKVSHYVTPWDGTKKFYCFLEGDCPGGDVVRCAWKGGHNWLFDDATANGGLVTFFLLQWTKPSHLGLGVSTGDEGAEAKLAARAARPLPLQEIELHEDDPTPAADFSSWGRTLEPAAKRGHYGDPDQGCQSDEEVVLAGRGRVCAPKIGASFAAAGDEAQDAAAHHPTPPTPQCELGGVAPSRNGCPVDAEVDEHSQAWPVCLAKGNATDAYMAGQFHCMLVCPCPEGAGADCGEHSHAHCPKGATCQRGELRHRAHGVCTYHGDD